MKQICIDETRHFFSLHPLSPLTFTFTLTFMLIQSHPTKSCIKSVGFLLYLFIYFLFDCGCMLCSILEAPPTAELEPTTADYTQVVVRSWLDMVVCLVAFFLIVYCITLPFIISRFLHCFILY